jgi:hypothetical protein
MRIAWCIAVTIALASGAACGDFPRTNPFDDQGTVSLVLVGPDSVTAVGDTIAFEVRSARGEPLNTLARWTVPSFLTPLDLGGRFVVTGLQSGARSTGTITASVNANVVSKPFTFAQRPARLSVSDCNGQTVVTFVSLMDPFYPTFEAKLVCSVLLDRRGFPVVDASTVSAVIRNPGVVQFVTADQRELNALSVGSTYVVYSRAGFTDSIRVNVRQDPASTAVYPPECWSSSGVVLTANQTVQLIAIPPVKDAHGNIITDYATVQVALASIQWLHESQLRVTISPTGLVTALGRSSGYVYGELGQGEAQRAAFGCKIIIN